MLIRKFVIRFGLVKGTILAGVLAMLLSFLVYITIAYIANSIRLIGIIISICIPAFVGSIFTFFSLRVSLMLYNIQEDLVKTQGKLEQNVAERTRELSAANESLKKEIDERIKMEGLLVQAKKMEAIGILAGGVAHDLNNILTGLVGYPELLLMKIPPDSPLVQIIRTIKESGEKAAAVVQDLLTLARRGVSVAEPINLNQIISKYLLSPEHDRLCRDHPNAVIETQLDLSLLNMLGSPVHISKTLMNLVTNSMESMPAGGTISVITGNRNIDEPIKYQDGIILSGDYVTLIVSDTGDGILPEEVGKIFEPFYTKKIMGKSGTGLGLAVVWATVKDHNGHITVDSIMGKGTIISLYFPATRQELLNKSAISSFNELIGHGESILIVDDMKEQRELAMMILNQLGYNPVVVNSGEEAIEYMKDHSAELILVDMLMEPGMNGIEAYKEIIKFHPDQKVIIVSGYSKTDRVQELINAGIGGYVKKPYIAEQLGKAIMMELNRKKSGA